MSKKLLATLTTILILFSMIAIAIQPASASPGIELETWGDATAEWTTEKAYSGLYSAKFTMPTDPTWSDMAAVKVPYGKTLSTVANDDLEFTYFTEVAHWPYPVLYLDTDANDLPDTLLVSSIVATTGTGSWVSTLPFDSWGKCTYHEVTGVTEPVADYKTLAEWTLYSDATLVYVALGYGAGSTGDIIYMDDIKIKAVTYPLEPEEAQFVTISPDLVKTGEECTFDIPVTNLVSTSSIYMVTIDYPVADEWTFVDVSLPDYWIIYGHDTLAGVITLKATGGYTIPPDGSASFSVTMTAASIITTKDYDWFVECTDTAEASFKVPLQVTVDGTPPPDVTVDAPVVDYYSVGAGGYMWLNISVTDDIEFLPEVSMNDTARFELLKVEHTAGTTEYKFCYVNKTAIEDGPLAVWFNVTDYVGNWYDGGIYIPDVGDVSALAETIVDNTAPIITIKVFDDATGLELPKVAGIYYMGTDVTTLRINYTAIPDGFDPDPSYTYVYINNTAKFTGEAVETNNAKNWTYSVTDINYLVINVTVTDSAQPFNHTTTRKQEVLRDLEGPYEVGFTAAEPICGGLIVRDLYALDLVGVLDYKIYNGTTLVTTILEEDLTSTTWTANSFNRIAVLDLSAYAGDFVNITVIARDYGENPSDEVILYAGVIPEGQWSAIVLQPEWNLISTSLIPVVEDIDSVLGGILSDPAAVLGVYWYDPVTPPYWSFWLPPPAVPTLTTIEDGNGYWMEMDAYDVLIIQGTITPPPGELPRVYHVYEGWNLIGYKSIDERHVTGTEGYIVTIPSELLDYALIFGWAAPEQEYYMVYAAAHEYDMLHPGEGYWLYMIGEADIVPPIP